MAIVTFPIAPTGDFCLACGQSMKTHGQVCVRDVVIGQDQHAIARRLRLVRLQTRPVRPGDLQHRVEGPQ